MAGDFRERGMFSTVIKAVLLLVLGFLGLRLGGPYVQSYQFARIIKEDVEAQSAVRPHVGQVHKRILELGKNMGLNLKPEDLSVSARQQGGFEIRVHYEVPVDLLFFQSEENFDFVSRPQASSAAE